MSSLDLQKLSTLEKNQLALTLGAFVLNDGKTPINADNLNKVLKASKNDVPSFWVTAFVQTLESTPIEKFLSVGGGAAPAPAQAEAKPAKEEKKVEAKKPEPKIEEEPVDMDMGDLFG